LRKNLVYSRKDYSRNKTDMEFIKGFFGMKETPKQTEGVPGYDVEHHNDVEDIEAAPAPAPESGTAEYPSAEGVKVVEGTLEEIELKPVEGEGNTAEGNWEEAA
jgi:hypothetical protein